MNIKFYNLSGNTGTYQETSSYIPGVVMGAALTGMESIGRPSETEAIETALRIEKDANNWQLWRAAFSYSNTTDDEWYLVSVLREVGTLTYGDTVSVTAVPDASLLHSMIDMIDYDADYPIVVTGTSLELNIAHHAKTVIFTSSSAITLTINTGDSKRQWWTRVIQGGTGQITLAASAYRNYNNAGTNVAHTIANTRYKATAIYSLSYPNYLVTV